MERKLFPADKNYILREVQSSSRKALLRQLVELVKSNYLAQSNPLGLLDDTVLRIQRSRRFPYAAFDEFYGDLAALYRYWHGEVQLEFLFDGKSHYQKYQVEWREYFLEYSREFMKNRFFERAVLDIAVFHRDGRTARLAGSRLKYFLIQYFGIKVYKYRGIRLFSEAS
jgi:hypothetical protein